MNVILSLLSSHAEGCVTCPLLKFAKGLFLGISGLSGLVWSVLH